MKTVVIHLLIIIEAFADVIENLGHTHQFGLNYQNGYLRAMPLNRSACSYVNETTKSDMRLNYRQALIDILSPKRPLQFHLSNELTWLHASYHDEALNFIIMHWSDWWRNQAVWRRVVAALWRRCHHRQCRCHYFSDETGRPMMICYFSPDDIMPTTNNRHQGRNNQYKEINGQSNGELAIAVLMMITIMALSIEANILSFYADIIIDYLFWWAHLKRSCSEMPPRMTAPSILTKLIIVSLAPHLFKTRLLASTSIIGDEWANKGISGPAVLSMSYVLQQAS